MFGNTGYRPKVISRVFEIDLTSDRGRFCGVGTRWTRSKRLDSTAMRRSFDGRLRGVDRRYTTSEWPSADASLHGCRGSFSSTTRAFGLRVSRSACSPLSPISLTSAGLFGGKSVYFLTSEPDIGQAGAPQKGLWARSALKAMPLLTSACL